MTDSAKCKYPIAGTDFFTKIMDEGSYYMKLHLVEDGLKLR